MVPYETATGEEGEKSLVVDEITYYYMPASNAILKLNSVYYLMEGIAYGEYNKVTVDAVDYFYSADEAISVDTGFIVGNKYMSDSVVYGYFDGVDTLANLPTATRVFGQVTYYLSAEIPADSFVKFNLYSENGSGSYILTLGLPTLVDSMTRYSQDYRAESGGDGEEVARYILVDGDYYLINSLDKYEMTADVNGNFYKHADKYYVLEGNRYSLGYIANESGTYYQTVNGYVLISETDGQVYCIVEKGVGLGEYVLDGGNYVLISSMTKYEFDSESGQYVENASGEYVNVDGEYKQLSTLTTYSYEIAPEEYAGTKYVKIGSEYDELVSTDKYNAVYSAAENGEYVLIDAIYVLIDTNEIYAAAASESGAFAIFGTQVIDTTTAEKYVLGETYSEDVNGEYILVDGNYVEATSPDLFKFGKIENNSVYDVAGDSWYLNVVYNANSYYILNGLTPEKEGYISKDYYNESVSGEYILDGDYVLYESLTKYAKDGDNYIESETGEYVYVGGEYVLLSSLTKYAKTVKYYISPLNVKGRTVTSNEVAFATKTEAKDSEDAALTVGSVYAYDYAELFFNGVRHYYFAGAVSHNVYGVVDGKVYYNYEKKALTLVQYDTYLAQTLSNSNTYSVKYGELYAKVNINGIIYAVIGDEYTGEDGVTNSASVSPGLTYNYLTYGVSPAFITQKSIRLSVSTLDSSPLTKQYDGTKEVYVPMNSAGTDYKELYYVSGNAEAGKEYCFEVMLGGLVLDEATYITLPDNEEAMSIAFNNEQASAIALDRNVVFEINREQGLALLSGAPARVKTSNYMIESAVVSKSATIEKKDINVKLVSGTATESDKLEATYTNVTATYEKDAIVNDAPYAVATYGDTIENTVYYYEYTFKLGAENCTWYTTGDGQYFASLADAYDVHMQNKEAVQYSETAVIDSATQAFVRNAKQIGLAGDMTLPLASCSANNFNNAGVYAITLKEGFALNYKFNVAKFDNVAAKFIYNRDSFAPGTEPGNETNYGYVRSVSGLNGISGVLFIQKRTAYAYTKNATKVYGAINPVVDVLFSSSRTEMNTNGLANGQLPSSISGDITREFYTWDYNELTGKYNFGSSVLLTSPVTDAENRYGIKLNLDRVNNRNYIVLCLYDEAVDAEENKVPLNLYDESGEVKGFVGELIIEYAAFQNVTLDNKSITYNGQEYKPVVVGNGTLVAGFNQTVQKITKQGVDVTAEGIINAGTYSVEVLITAPGYKDTVMSSTVVIKPCAVNLAVFRESHNYDRLSHGIDGKISAGDVLHVTYGGSLISYADIM
ncbi:MAG: hypothetical protein ACI4QU_00620, partial [Christensenellales bacterium]